MQDNQTVRPIQEKTTIMYTGLTTAMSQRLAQLEERAVGAVAKSLAKATTAGATTYLTNATTAELTWLRALAAGKTAGYTMDKKCGHGMWRVEVAS